MSALPVTVAIVEDDAHIRKLLQMTIDEDSRFSCGHTYPTGEAAITDFEKGLPDVILMDVEMPGMSGIECVKRIRSFNPDVAILMLTVHDDDETLFAALCAGATGYLVKGMPTEDLLQAIAEAHTGGAPMSSAIARRVVASFQTSSESVVSSREQEVLELLCKGDSYKDVAEKLYISKHTVRRHIRSIYKKLEVTSRAEMVRKAHKERLVD